MRLIFLRHTQTTANERGCIYGKKDYPLTLKGEIQLSEAVRNVRDFPFSYIISSPLGRALKLAEAASKETGRKLMTDERLEEMNQGIFEGLTVEEAELEDPEAYEGLMSGDMSFAVPEGESYEVFQSRVASAIEEIIDRGEDVLIVSHGGVIRTSIELLIDFEPGYSWTLDIGNGAVIDLIWQEDRCQIKNIINIEEDEG